MVIAIDAKSGNILGTLDLSSLTKNVRSACVAFAALSLWMLDLCNLCVSHSVGSDVLNGIAYDATTQNFYVTGKNWKNMYEISIL